ncbi:MAG: hypothetical protein COB29_11425 [Sulfitobacter sp.]|nr:MAG: hypothetical protein COB29_11425 [Sulfitobacter sp.]
MESIKKEPSDLTIDIVKATDKIQEMTQEERIQEMRRNQAFINVLNNNLSQSPFTKPEVTEQQKKITIKNEINAHLVIQRLLQKI